MPHVASCRKCLSNMKATCCAVDRTTQILMLTHPLNLIVCYIGRGYMAVHSRLSLSSTQRPTKHSHETS